MSKTAQQGEFRSMRADEIARIVTTFRQTLGMKQLALALEAGIDERTVQRIEHGERVSDDTLRRVAKALRMNEDALVGPRYINTPEEAAAKVEKALSEMLTVEARNFTAPEDCENFLGVHGFIVNADNVGPESADVIAEFRDLLSDFNDLYPELSYTDRLEGSREVEKVVRKLEANGYRVRYCSYTSDDEYRISALMVVPKSDEHLNRLTEFLVPRNAGQMMRESIARGC